MTRDEVLREFGTAECVKRDECDHWDCRAERLMADEIVKLREKLQQQGVELLQERERMADAQQTARYEAEMAEQARQQLATVDAERDQFASMLYDCENERDGLRDKLAEVEESREILKAYYDDAVKVGTRCATIIAALREPSEAVVKAAVLHYSGDLRDAIRAAVAAAEREVGA